MARHPRTIGVLVAAMLASIIALSGSAGAGEDHVTANIETDGEVHWNQYPPRVPTTVAWTPQGGTVVNQCSTATKMWVQEVDTSGISRMRLSYDVYDRYIVGPAMLNGALAQKSTAPITYPRDSNVELPNDDRDFYIWAELPHGVMVSEFSASLRLVAHFVGERPSIWNPDVVHNFELGDINGCDATECAFNEGAGGALGGGGCADNIAPSNDGSGGGGVVAPPGLESDPNYQDVDQDGIPDAEDDDLDGDGVPDSTPCGVYPAPPCERVTSDG